MNERCREIVDPVRAWIWVSLHLTGVSWWDHLVGGSCPVSSLQMDVKETASSRMMVVGSETIDIDFYPSDRYLPRKMLRCSYLAFCRPMQYPMQGRSRPPRNWSIEWGPLSRGLKVSSQDEEVGNGGDLMIGYQLDYYIQMSWRLELI